MVWSLLEGSGSAAAPLPLRAVSPGRRRSAASSSSVSSPSPLLGRPGSKEECGEGIYERRTFWRFVNCSNCSFNNLNVMLETILTVFYISLYLHCQHCF